MRKLLEIDDSLALAGAQHLYASRGLVLRGLPAGHSSQASVQAILERLQARELASVVQAESGLDGQGRW